MGPGNEREGPEQIASLVQEQVTVLSYLHEKQPWLPTLLLHCVLLERGVLQTHAHEWGSTDNSACSLFSSRHAEHLLVLWAHHANQVQAAALSGFQQQQKKATKNPPKSVAKENSGPLQPDTLLKIITPLHQVKLISIASASRDHGEKRRKLWTQNFFIVLKLPAHQWSWALSYSELSGAKWSSLASHTAESNTAVRGQRQCCCVACTKVQDRASHKEQLSANNKRLESTDNTNKHAEHVEDPEKTNTTKERKFKIWLLLSYVWRCH